MCKVVLTHYCYQVLLKVDAAKGKRKRTALEDEEEKWRRTKCRRKAGKYSNKKVREELLTPKKNHMNSTIKE